MKSDDEKLRELFEVEDKDKPTFKNVIKKAKLISLVKSVIVSLMIFIIVGFILLMSNASILNSMSNKKEFKLRNWYSIALPNAYMGNVQVDDRLFVGQIDYIRYRFLGDKPVTNGSFKEEYTYVPLINGIYGEVRDYLSASYGETGNELQYDKTGKPIMKFYHPAVKYYTYINDLDNLNKIDSSKLVEIALSFDKDYSIDEVKKMLHSNITLNWYWVDTYNSKDSKEIDGRVFDEYGVYGIKALDNQGKPVDNPEGYFINAIINGKQTSNSSGIYRDLYDTLRNGKDKITKEDLKIIGVVVSGKVEDLKSLKGSSYIKASTFGATADRY